MASYLNLPYTKRKYSSATCESDLFFSISFVSLSLYWFWMGKIIIININSSSNNNREKKKWGFRIVIVSPSLFFSHHGCQMFVLLRSPQKIFFFFYFQNVSPQLLFYLHSRPWSMLTPHWHTDDKKKRKVKRNLYSPPFNCFKWKMCLYKKWSDLNNAEIICLFIFLLRGKIWNGFLFFFKFLASHVDLTPYCQCFVIYIQIMRWNKERREKYHIHTHTLPYNCCNIDLTVHCPFESNTLSLQIGVPMDSIHYIWFPVRTLDGVCQLVSFIDC